MRGLLTLAFLLWSAAAQATTYYVATAGDGGSDSNNGLTISTPKLTVNAGRALLSGGDTLYIRGGSYTLAAGTSVPAGTSSTTRTLISSYNNEAVTITFTATGSHGLEVGNNTDLYGIDWNAANLGSNILNGIKLTSTSNVTVSGPAPVNGVFKCKIRNSPSIGFNVQGTTSNVQLHYCELAANGLAQTTSPYAHGIYIQRTTGFVMTGNYIHGSGCMGMQIYPYAQNAVVRGNRFHNNGQTSGCGTEVVLANSGHTFENNIISKDTGETGFAALRMQYGSGGSPSNMTIRNNTIYGPSGLTNCIYLASNATNNLVQNNITLGCTTKINNLGTGNTLTTNRTTGTPADIFTSVVSGSYDLTLKAGSAAIDAGTNVGKPFCGSPDQGAHEKPVVVAASIAGNTLDVTVCSTSPPMQLLGTWTPGCTGSGCGNPAAGSVSVFGGSGGIVRVPIDGITGGACAAGQTWTISASGANTDSANVGGSNSQSLHTVSNFAVDSSACDGEGGPAPPASSEAQYEFEDDLTDSSGNENDAIGSSNTSFTTGKIGQGLLTTANVESYVDTGLLDNYAPGTNHLVVATSLYLDPSVMGQLKDIFGTGLDTGTDRFFLYRTSSNNLRAGIGATFGGASEFTLTSGWNHVALKMDPATNTATVCHNGQSGTVTNGSLFTYSDYNFASTLRVGLPSGFATSLSGAHKYDQFYIYTSDVSCAALYAATEPPSVVQAATQAGHRRQGVYQLNGAAEDRGEPNDEGTVVQDGAVAVKAQINNESGGTIVVQPRWRYRIDGGEALLVPDEPTVNGISYWGPSRPAGLNVGPVTGPISGALDHTDGLMLTDSAAVPTLDMGDQTSYTLGGLFRINMPMPDPVNPPRVCFELWDQGGTPLAAIPGAGLCFTQKPTQASGVN